MGRWNDVKTAIRIHLFDRLFDRKTLQWLRWVKKEKETEGDFGPVTVPDDEHQHWLDSLKEGDLVCDCRFRHLKIVRRVGDDALLSDGSSCSLSHCCDPADHPDPHPVVGFGDLDLEHGAKGPKYGSDEID